MSIILGSFKLIQHQLLPKSFAVFQRYQGIASTSVVRNLEEQFQKAQEQSKGIKDPSNETKLKLYALFKQSTVGKINTKKPGMFDIVGNAKYSAWKSLENLSTVILQINFDWPYVLCFYKIIGGCTATIH